jgi:hypothetical protein
MRAIYENFSRILDDHFDDLKRRPRGYRERLSKEYIEKFPDATPLTYHQVNYFLSTYRMTHEIPREYGSNYPYLTAWKARVKESKEERETGAKAQPEEKVYPNVITHPK